MDSIKIIFPFPPSSNMAYPTIKRGNKLIRIKSKRLKDWINSAPVIDESISGMCTVSYKLFPPDNANRDGQSYLKAILDYIVNQGVIPDDNLKVVVGEQWVLGEIDSVNPRIEVIIKNVNTR